jgi:hypothetical protein
MMNHDRLQVELGAARRSHAPRGSSRPRNPNPHLISSLAAINAQLSAFGSQTPAVARPCPEDSPPQRDSPMVGIVKLLVDASAKFEVSVVWLVWVCSNPAGGSLRFHARRKHRQKMADKH